MRPIAALFIVSLLCTTAIQAATSVTTTNNGQPASGPHDGAPPGGNPPPNRDQMFKDMDSNGDGVVSKTEFDAFRPPHPPQGGPGGNEGKHGGPPPANSAPNGGQPPAPPTNALAQ